MPNLNRVMLMGNLTRDPELRHLPSGNPVVNVGIAINRRWKNQAGEQQEEVTFLDCEAYAKTAELINQYMKKGKPIFIEGRLKLDQWQDKEGNNRSKIKVIIENFQFIDSRGGSEGDGGGDGGGSYQQRPYQPRQQPARAPAAAGAPRSAPAPAAPPDGGGDHEPIAEGDIPF